MFPTFIGFRLGFMGDLLVRLALPLGAIQFVLSVGLLWFDRPGRVYAVSFLCIGLLGMSSRLYRGPFARVFRMGGFVCLGACLALWLWGLAVWLVWPFEMSFKDTVIFFLILVWEALLIASVGISVLHWGR
ncbi:hypothetical protein TheveDRAFT_1332 [Thermanaerovibrio velox DSM 12556]|uniref:Uncharacterized protein n=2 Tax=Thermanaerovibrio TaxID=81461 RepID=H0UNN6_9BACT|nr:hypothetical protein TheveDRAFT_1332 [Thermanaerovibrio velox DSM 12556]